MKCKKPSLIRLANKWCYCSHAGLGYGVCWFDVVYRTASILTISEAISRQDNRSTITLCLSFLLLYTYISLATNLFCIVGISKNNDSFIIWYIVIHIFEIILGLVAIIWTSFVYNLLYDSKTVVAVIVATVLGTALYILKWLCLMEIYEKVKRDNKVENAAYDKTKLGIFHTLRNHFRNSGQLKLSN